MSSHRRGVLAACLRASAPYIIFATDPEHALLRAPSSTRGSARNFATGVIRPGYHSALHTVCPRQGPRSQPRAAQPDKIAVAR